MNPVVWTALVTPLNPRGEICFDDLGILLRMQESAGNGVVILGSTGESLNLTADERRAVVEFTVSRKLHVPVMVGIGGHDLPGTLEWLSWLETRSVDAYLMVTPHYAKPGPEGQYHWFRTLMDAVSRPCMLYNVPGRAGVALSRQALVRLSDHPNLWSVKEASGSTDEFSAYTAAVPNHPVLSGDDGMMPDYSELGVQGLVSVAANAWPEATRLYTERALSGSLDAAEVALWQEASRCLFSASNPVPVKALLAAEGILGSATVKLPLHASDMTGLEALMRVSRRIRAWYASAADAQAEMAASEAAA